MTTIAVDWTRCDGHGLCGRLLHEKISLDEWGFPIIDDPELEPYLVKAARQAAMACPVLALRVE
jgi:ferredoxin